MSRLAHVAKEHNVRVVAVSDTANTACSIRGDRPCLFDVVTCGGLGAKLVVEDLVILSTFSITYSTTTTLVSHVAEKVAPGVMRVQLARPPPMPGTYEAISRLQWYNGSCSYPHFHGASYLGGSRGPVRQLPNAQTQPLE